MAPGDRLVYSPICGHVNVYFTYLGLLRIRHGRRPALASMVRSTWSNRLAMSSASWCPGMDASWLYRKYSSLQCLYNMFFNVLTCGAVTTVSGNSFHTLVTLTGKDCRLKFNFEPSWHNVKLCPVYPPWRYDSLAI